MGDEAEMGGGIVNRLAPGGSRGLFKDITVGLVRFVNVDNPRLPPGASECFGKHFMRHMP